MRKVAMKLGALIVFLSVMLLVLEYDPPAKRDLQTKHFVCILHPGYYFWKTMEEGVRQAGEEMDIYVETVACDYQDVEEQIRQMQRAVYVGADGIITVGDPESQELDEMIQSVQEQGIPVVLVDTDSRESGRCCYIGTDNYKVGQEAAEVIAKETGETAKILVIVSWMDYGNQKARYQGFSDTVSSYEGLEIVSVIEGKSDKETVQQGFRDALERSGPIDAVYCAEGNAPAHIGAVLKENSDNGKTIVVGMEMSEPIKELVEKGILTGTFVQDTYQIGYQAVKSLYEYCEAPEKEPSEIALDCVYETAFDKDTLK